MKNLSDNSHKTWTTLGLVTLVALVVFLRRRRTAAAADASEVVQEGDIDV